VFCKRSPVGLCCAVTGKLPGEHGIVGNGWYFRDDCEVRFWRQSNKLVKAPKVWEAAREQNAAFTVAKVFWWYNMYSSADFSVTPRPCYPSDGRKIPDIYTQPPELRDALQDKLGGFPLFSFWGPKTTIASSQWIADSAKHIELAESPTLSLVYLPHLDYCLQKVGPSDKSLFVTDLNEVDAVVGDLIDFYEDRDVTVMLLSEYGISAVTRPIHINRALREAGMITVREELGLELLDCGACRAFAVSDHQIAHVYINDHAVYGKVLELLKGLDGVDLVLDDEGKKAHDLDHARAGDIVVVAKPDAWFTYYYWLDDTVAPDFARCVNIHSKPGYDPVELFVDPEIPFPMAKAGFRLMQKQLGFRYLMDLIPLDANLVRGSHGCLQTSAEDGAIFMSKTTNLLDGKSKVAPTDVFNLILRHLDLDPIDN
jgi:predicted AlkP superfamily pyrophosphatase or phosphodiesterase